MLGPVLLNKSEYREENNNGAYRSGLEVLADKERENSCADQQQNHERGDLLPENTSSGLRAAINQLVGAVVVEACCGFMR
ncbi:unannotated protein [freshwater metagenome]|uniref:Unannotated protein n=1 Tax=freshwater metagenome TaxID=449393 RepID=A0A6J7Q835_9ZZZZ